MNSKTFIINFSTNVDCITNRKSDTIFDYHAEVTILSNSLSLYKVSNIQQVCFKGRKTIYESYYLSSYPIKNNKQNGWIDPIKLSSGTFIKVLGEEIRKVLESRTTTIAMNF